MQETGVMDFGLYADNARCVVRRGGKINLDVRLGSAAPDYTYECGSRTDWCMAGRGTCRDGLIKITAAVLRLPDALVNRDDEPYY